MLRHTASFFAFILLAGIASIAPARAYLPPPLARLNHDVRNLARHLRAATALDIFDLYTGYNAGFNAARSMPAASTIKLPVMVEVFTQLETGRFDLQHRMTLEAADKDYGSGVLCDEPAGTTHPVSELVEKMIDISDNTATNMLIRLVGRRDINRQMEDLGLEHTHLAGDVRTYGWAIRETLRTSPADLVRLLTLMARHKLVDEWSSNEMIGILEADQINTLLPEPLPPDIPIAHKTGSLNDTLNDAGIVFASDAPYVIAVMTTALPSEDLGRSFIHSVSRLAYADELRLAHWRESTGANHSTGVSPDTGYWNAGSDTPAADAPPADAPASDAPAADMPPADAPTAPPAR
jgi:beta-lactamase class A